MSNDAVSSTESTESTTENTEEVKTVSVEQFNDLKQMLEKVQKSQSGVDSANTKLREEKEVLKLELDEQKKNAMTPDQKLEYEREIREAEQKASQGEVKELKRSALVKDFLLEHNLPKKFEKYLKGDTLEALEAESKELLTGIDEEVEKRVKDKIKTPTPQSGTSGTPPVDTSKMTYAELVRHNAES